MSRQRACCCPHRSLLAATHQAHPALRASPTAHLTAAPTRLPPPAEWANQCLQMLTLGSGASLHSLAHHHEIYPGSKLTHFRRIHERTGIAYTDMLVSLGWWEGGCERGGRATGWGGAREGGLPACLPLSCCGWLSEGCCACCGRCCRCWHPRAPPLAQVVTPPSVRPLLLGPRPPPPPSGRPLRRAPPPPPPLQFLDDMQMTTRECARLGLVAVHTPKGLTAAAWQKGLHEFAERRRGKAS